MRRWSRRFVIASLLTVGGWFLWQAIQPREPEPAELFQPVDGMSVDLQADIRLMWQTTRLAGDAGPAAGPDPRRSTEEAIKAASRVFNSVDLAGKTREEVVALLGDPRRSSDSVYNFPFYPAPRGSLVYRFDTGCYGWQFNVVFGLWGNRVVAVHRHGIE